VLVAVSALAAGIVGCEPGPADNAARPETETSQSEEAAMPRESNAQPQSVHDFTMTDIDGNEVDLGQYRGKVLLLVNVASKCGFTGQYEGLQDLYETYKDRGFVILGFPANNFMGQEPGTNAEIKQFCSTTYGVTFPMFAKISVKGSDQHPLYRFLTDKATNPEHGGKISWNFNKFLVDRGGRIVNRFGSRTKPQDKEVIEAVEAALGEQPG
jgi:glutathione peroxidase